MSDIITLNRRQVLMASTAAVAVAGLAGGTAARAAASAATTVAIAPAPVITRRSLWYDKAAAAWSSEALPVGNGRLGAMLFGGPGSDQVHLNEQSLWGGLNNYDNALMGKSESTFDTSMTGFGSYRSFGSLVVDFTGIPAPGVAPGGAYTTSANETIAASIDGLATTKWCIQSPPSQVVWRATLVAPQTVTAYSLTSANDVPTRDPQNWTFEGSDDGSAWTVLDTRQIAPFESRGLKKTFTLPAPATHQYYRFVFTPISGVSHFQVAEVTLDEVDFAAAMPGYVRALDPVTGVHTSTFLVGDTRHVREAFATRDGDVLVLRYRTSGAEGFSGTISLTSGQNADAAEPPTKTSVTAAGDRMRFANRMRNNLRYAADAQIRAEGGTLARNGQQVSFADCSELEIRIDLRTDHRLDAGSDWRSGKDPAVVAAATLAAVAGRSYDQLRAAHEAGLMGVLNRISVDWGTTDDEVMALPLNERLARYEDGTSADPELERLLFTYGRYLLASSSRPDGLPANLQGLWNNSNQPAWGSDYHTNINVQMNYWAAETTALSDSHEALIRFIEQVAVPSRVATRNAFGEEVRGWTTRTSQSPFGGNGWEWNTVGSAWYMQHVYEHWRFTQDRAFLARTYPLVKEVCEFWEDHLVEREVDGVLRLVAPNGWSPEHGPREDGVMYDQQIIWDLFSNYLEMAAALGVDHDYQDVVADMRARLAPNKIGSWGQLQEWQTDRDLQTDLHRHTSHLFAVFPGRQITTDATPELAAAALTSLNARCGVPDGGPIGVDTVNGDSRRSWTWPWRTALFARLGEPQRAYAMLRGHLKHNTLTNLFADHPPFQMDGNFGMPGAMTELLLQSHDGKIRILPACPAQWSAAGSFTGLRARGGYAVNATWSGGRVTSYEVFADRASDRSPVTVVVNGEEREVVPTKQDPPPAPPTPPTPVPVPPAPGATPPTTLGRTASRARLRVSERRVRVGRTIRVEVKVPGGAGARVELRRDGTRIRSGRLGADDTIRFRLNPGRPASFNLRAVFDGSDTKLPTKSDAIAMTVLPKRR